jgi:glycosyltransferase involved in cell wall biosynthesis
VSRGKVLLVTSLPFFQWRGSPIRLGFDAMALARLGYEVDLLTVPVGEERTIPGVTVHRVANPFTVRNLPIGPSLHKLVFDFLLLARALAMAGKHRYVAVHGIEDTGIIAWAAGRRGGARVVFEKHSDPASYQNRPLKTLLMAAYRMVEHLAMRRADAIIGTGEGLCEQARAAAPGKPVFHIFDIPSSLTEPDPARALAIGKGWRKAPDEILVLYVGSFAVYQGIDLMFESMPHVLRRHPKTRFVIIGGTDDEIAARTGWLRHHGIAGQVAFAGKIPPDELPHHLAAADILLSPRQAGINTPLKLLDYLKVSRPIVATNNEANRRILDDSFAVLTEATPEAFAAGIGQLVEKRDQRAAFGKKGRDRIDQTYNFDEYTRRMGEVYAAFPSRS